ncbi:transposase [Cupriavidus sp. IDO]|nr:transposase [Cupriavidus sp. IDO]
MPGFLEPKRTQAFLSRFGPIRPHFALKWHLLRASRYRKQFAARFPAWREHTELTRNPSAAFRAMGTLATSPVRLC